VTYSNACFAACTVDSVRHDGACGATCFADSQCAASERCVGAVVPPPGTMPPVRAGECRPIDWCDAVADCASLAPTTICVGAWSCETHACRYHCGTR
jgi:hypothetical protein